jgi:general L-amino acid transport system substrate-binding protein
MRVGRWFRLLSIVAVLALAGAACSDDDDDGGNGAAEEGGDDEAAGGGQEEGGGSGLLAEVQDRGTLRCGVNNTVPGFGFQDEQGNFAGFDIDFCRVIAAAVLGDAEAVEFVAITDPAQRFPTLREGSIDVMVSNTTWTSSRDGAEGAAFVHTTFFDGQGMMVRADAGITEIDQLANRTICTTTGTTTELNLETRMTGIPHTPRGFADNTELQAAFIGRQCDGWTSDKSQLAGIRSNWPADQGGPEALVILDETFSKEPLGPVVVDGDSEWFDAVQWAVVATIQAEEFGIASDNVDQFLTSENPDILRFLGQPVSAEEGATPEPFDSGLGLDPEFALNVIQQVGNFGEIYDRNVGPGTPLGLERDGSLNALWTEGGLIYAPPYR